MSLDYSNFLLAANAPTLLAEGPGYEQRRFAQDLEAGTTTLAKTYRWWRLARAKVVAEADRRNPENVSTPANRVNPSRIYVHGLVDLATAFGELRDIDVPETLGLDKARLARIRDDIRKIVTIGTILLTAKNLLKRDVRSQWKTEATRMWESLRDGESGNADDSLKVDADLDVLLPTTGLSITEPPPAVYEPPKTVSHKPTTVKETSPPTTDDSAPQILSAIESAHALPPTTKSQLSSIIRRALDQRKSQHLTDPVMKLLHNRLKTHIMTRCLASSASERVRAASTATSSLAASGLPEFSAQVGALVEEVVRVGEVDRASHGGWYEAVAGEVEGECDGGVDG